MNRPPSHIKLVYWNCASLAQRLKDGSIHALLNPDLTPDPPTILALVETRWVDQDPSLHKRRAHAARLPYVPNYTWAHRHHTSRSGGIAVLYHNSIACLPMAALNELGASLDNDPTSAAAALWLTVRYPHSPPFLLGVGYLPPYKTNAPSTGGVRGLCASLGQASSHQLPVLLVGDFNLHHGDWEDAWRFNISAPSAASAEFADYVKDTHWTVLNPSLMPDGVTRPASRTDGFDAVIDLAITDSPHLFLSMDTGYKDVLHSDHYPVTLTAMLAAHTTAPPTPTHTRKRTQWSVHHQPEVWQAALPVAMDSALADWIAAPIEQPADAAGAGPRVPAEPQLVLDRAYSELEAIFVRTCEQVVGTRVSSATTKHWFNYPGIKAAYWYMKRTRRVWKHSRVPCAMKAGAALMAMDAWKALVREAKAVSWSQLCADIQSTPKSKLQWTMFMQSRGRVSSPLTSFASASGEAPAHVGQSLNHLCDHFVTASVPPPLDANSTHSAIEIDYLQPRLNPTSEAGDSALPPHESDNWTFTPAAVEEQCTFQHTDSAPGCDAILPIFLKHAGKALYAALASVFTYSWRYAVLPQQWTEANVMALYKGKGARSDPASYRPISMTSIIVRTFEHLVQKRLSAPLEAASFFHPLQFGFRKHHSTLDAINYLQYNTRAQYILTGTTIRTCPTLFLDIQKAFDRVWHPKLLQEVERAGITGRAWRWLHAFLSRRRIRTVYGNHQSEWRRMEYGVPQGAVLSPLLFNIFINTLAKRLATACPRLNVQLYADDIAIQPRAPPLVNGRRPRAKPSQSRSHPVYDIDLPNCFRLLNPVVCGDTDEVRRGQDRVGRVRHEQWPVRPHQVQAAGRPAPVWLRAPSGRRVQVLGRHTPPTPELEHSGQRGSHPHPTGQPHDLSPHPPTKRASLSRHPCPVPRLYACALHLCTGILVAHREAGEADAGRLPPTDPTCAGPAHFVAPSRCAGGGPLPVDRVASHSGCSPLSASGRAAAACPPRTSHQHGAATRQARSRVPAQAPAGAQGRGTPSHQPCGDRSHTPPHQQRARAPTTARTRAQPHAAVLPSGSQHARAASHHAHHRRGQRAAHGGHASGVEGGRGDGYGCR